MIGQELFLSWSAQLRLLFEAAVQGVFAALVYEALRVLRRLLPHGDVAVALEDTAFGCFAALWAFGFLLRASQGRPRAFLLLGMACGAGVYFATVGRLVFRAADRAGARLRRKHAAKPEKIPKFMKK